MSKFQRVETHSDWCDFDRLDGTDLVHGEKVVAKWPDGTEEHTKVIVEKSSYEMSDMGTPCTIPQQTAYLEIVVRGVKVNVPLRKSKILLKRV